MATQVVSSTLALGATWKAPPDLTIESAQASWPQGPRPPWQRHGSPFSKGPGVVSARAVGSRLGHPTDLPPSERPGLCHPMASNPSASARALSARLAFRTVARRTLARPLLRVVSPPQHGHLRPPGPPSDRTLSLRFIWSRFLSFGPVVVSLTGGVAPPCCVGRGELCRVGRPYPNPGRVTGRPMCSRQTAHAGASSHNPGP